MEKGKLVEKTHDQEIRRYNKDDQGERERGRVTNSPFSDRKKKQPSWGDFGERPREKLKDEI